MTWHEHLEKLPSKGEITILSGSTTIMTTVNGFIGDFQPILSFSIAAVAGFFTIWVGWLAVREKKLRERIEMAQAIREKELHDLVMQKQQLEILKLKEEYNEKN